MQEIIHKINHQYQPTPTTCSPTALSMLLDHYDTMYSVDEISKQVPQVRDSEGNEAGSVAQQMATWCTTLGFKVNFFTFDCQIIDQSWAALPPEKIIERLTLRKGGNVVPSMGEDWTKAYAQSYIDLLEHKAELTIQPAVTSALLYDLLKGGPIFASVCMNTLYGKGRTSTFNGPEADPDDIHGRVWNHNLVIYGNDADGNLMLADPDEKPGLLKVTVERMIAAISTAQIECDNVIFQLSKN